MVVGLGVMLSANVGCQQWSFRENTTKMFGAEANDDDWAPPTDITYDLDERSGKEKNRRSKGLASKWWPGRGEKDSESPPRVILPKDRDAQKKLAEANALLDAHKNPVESNSKSTKSGAVVGNGGNSASLAATDTKANNSSITAKPEASTAASSNAASNSSVPGSSATTAPTSAAPTSTIATSDPAKPEAPLATSVVDTGLQQVDLEGALQSLPSQYRDTIRKSIQEMQMAEQKSQASKAEPTPVAGVVAGVTDESKALAVATLKEAASQETNEGDVPLSEVRTADFHSETDNASGGVTVRLGKGDGPSSQVVASSHHSAAIGDVATSLSPSSAVHSAATNHLSWSQQTSLAIETLESQLEQSPSADLAMRTSQEITLRMLYVAQRRLDEALRPIESLSENEQIFVQNQMRALYEASNPDANPSRARHGSLVMSRLREATDHLSNVANLEVRDLAFCDEVGGYGIYQRCKKYQFAPDQDVLLYCEIDHVTAERVKSGFETQLQGSYEIVDSQKRKITEQLLPMEPELCQNQRRDYYIVYRIFMPQQIQPGKHELILTIEDMKGHKYGQSLVEFEIKK
jgi:hypothetical protein